MIRLYASAVAAALLSGRTVFAADTFKLDSKEDITKSAKILAEDLMAYYKGGQSGNPVGLLPSEYYWWESSTLWATMIDYWHLTGDDEYNDVTSAGILAQIGDDKDFMPANQTATMGNDDQCFWALSAMMAAEDDFPNPSGKNPAWLTLAKTVFDQLEERVDEKTCDGGLRWQIMPVNNGYNYKNTLSNGCMFDLAARLARYTGNSTYADSAAKSWDWLTKIGLVDEKTGAVYDGGQVNDKCSTINKIQFSNTASILVHGAAVMYNYTEGSKEWNGRVSKLASSTLSTFFPDGIANEVACEKPKTCNLDMRSFKGTTIRFLAGAAQLAPSLETNIVKTFKTSAAAAVKQCTGGKSGRDCGFYWSSGKYVDRKDGAGEQMNVLAVVSNLLIEDAGAPVTGKTAKNDEKKGSDESSGGASSETPSSTTGSAAQTSEPSGAGRVEIMTAMLGLVVGVSSWAGLF